MKNINKQKLVFILLLLVALFPNLLALVITKGSNRFELLIWSISLVLIPGLFLRRKIWMFFLSPFVLFSAAEIFPLLTIHSRIDNVIIASTLATNKNEASELLFGNIPLVLLCVGLVAFYFFLLKRLKTNTYLSLKSRLLIVLFFIGFLFVKFITTQSSEGGMILKTKQLIVNSKEKLSYFVYPSDLVYNSSIYVREKVKENRAIKNLENFKFDIDSKAEKADIIVFVIGETSRAQNWSLLGYDRKTNPELEKEENLFALSNTYACANSTYTSLPMLLTITTPHNQDGWQQAGNLVQAFKEAGYATAWIGGQSQGHLVVNLAEKYSDYVDYEIGDDASLFTKAKEFIANKQKVFVVIHTEGSHFDYSKRYPAKFDFFKPSKFNNISIKNKEEIINAYDNSILYTDYLISDMLKFLKTQNNKSALYYTSDHGENLYDNGSGLLFHAQQNKPTNYELHVPTLIWVSDSFKESFTEKIVAFP